MTFRLIIQKRAETQISEAYNWYEQKQRYLGDVFLQSLDTVIATIIDNPYLYQVKYKKVYAAQTKKFPYGVFYIVDGDKIVVLAVFHLSRNPGLWKKLNKGD